MTDNNDNHDFQSNEGTFLFPGANLFSASPDINNNNNNYLKNSNSTKYNSLDLNNCIINNNNLSNIPYNIQNTPNIPNSLNNNIIVSSIAKNFNNIKNSKVSNNAFINYTSTNPDAALNTPRINKPNTPPILPSSTPILDKKNFAEFDKILHEAFNFDSGIAKSSTYQLNTNTNTHAASPTKESLLNFIFPPPDTSNNNIPNFGDFNDFFDLQPKNSFISDDPYPPLFDSSEEKYLKDFLSNFESAPLVQDNILSDLINSETPLTSSKNVGIGLFAPEDPIAKKEHDLIMSNVNLLSINSSTSKNPPNPKDLSSLGNNNIQFEKEYHSKNFAEIIGADDLSSALGNNAFKNSLYPSSTLNSNQINLNSTLLPQNQKNINKVENWLSSEVLKSSQNPPQNKHITQEYLSFYNNHDPYSTLYEDPDIFQISEFYNDAKRNNLNYIPISNISQNTPKTILNDLVINESNNSFSDNLPKSFQETSFAKRQSLRQENSLFDLNINNSHGFNQKYSKNKLSNQSMEIQNLKRTASELDNAPENLFLSTSQLNSNVLAFSDSQNSFKPTSYQNHINTTSSVTPLLQKNETNIKNIDSSANSIKISTSNFESAISGSLCKDSSPTTTSSTLLAKKNTDNSNKIPAKKSTVQKSKIKKLPDALVAITKDQKRLNHIESERKRRNYIKSLFEELTELVSGNSFDALNVDANTGDNGIDEIESNSINKSGEPSTKGKPNKVNSQNISKASSKKGKKTKASKAMIIESAVTFIANLKNENARLRSLE
ncbi:hypothetical protein AYI69_g9020 [Smittium culicis]|uniref:BHLH domain-containing protein n=1 Tax=Smittium culicis TaxID=133412 RepID=A0A1R1XFK4_9FUNG|nr:hypothetical protein AYI69_g9020 [Smittium culicis]